MLFCAQNDVIGFGGKKKCSKNEKETKKAVAPPAARLTKSLAVGHAKQPLKQSTQKYAVWLLLSHSLILQDRVLTLYLQLLSLLFCFI